METQTTLADTLFDLDHDTNFPLKSKTHGFLIITNNGFIDSGRPFQTAADMEMVPLTYTSLRDLLPEPPVIVSPAYDRGDSWREIPIKDPLLQHAAWAYLQPATTASSCKADDRNCADKWKDCCLGLFGCFGEFFNDVVTTVIRRWLWGEEEEECLGVLGDDSDKFD